VEVVATVPVTPPETVIFDVVSVEVFIASLNTTVIALLMATLVALVLGLRLDTVGTTSSCVYGTDVAEHSDALPAASVAVAHTVVVVLAVTLAAILKVPPEATPEASTALVHVELV
jgi:hypothetical protein